MSDPSSDNDGVVGRPSSLLDQRHMSDNDLSKLRNAMLEREGLIVSIFELLRTVPK
jgi:aarF domain-containing kinase